MAKLAFQTWAAESTEGSTERRTRNHHFNENSLCVGFLSCTHVYDSISTSMGQEEYLSISELGN